MIVKPVRALRVCGVRRLMGTDSVVRVVVRVLGPAHGPDSGVYSVVRAGPLRRTPRIPTPGGLPVQPAPVRAVSMGRRTPHTRRARTGFTIIEVMVVLVILGLIGGIVT
ncbi:MAG: prepilin-type N-terminal cleavage/methylation domain-containing protein, partial [Planctomycetota bacterium]